MSNLNDVAKLAGVHPATVSRALNNVSYVHPDTKARILAAVAELNYHPNIITNSIRKGKQHTIGVVVPNVRLSIFGDIAQTIDTEARKAGYSILFCHTNDDPQTEYGCLDRLRAGFVDGIIIASTGRNMSLIPRHTQSRNRSDPDHPQAGQLNQQHSQRLRGRQLRRSALSLQQRVQAYRAG